MVSIDIIKNLIKEICNYNHSIGESTINLVINDEIESINYVDSVTKLAELSKHSYKDYHYVIRNNNREYYYEVFVYDSEYTNPDNLYKIILCNNRTAIYKNDKCITDFRNPGKVYTFYNYNIIIIENEYRMDFEYEEI